jgi:filamentous hemagglutinin family protein
MRLQSYRLLAKVFILCVVAVARAKPVSAQIKADGTVGTQVITDNQAQIHQISNGVQLDQNLLHSFSDFSVTEGWLARFQLSDNTSILNQSILNNIIVRVTGSDISKIFGTLSVDDIGHPVSLFLINPQGIIFGPHAQLDLTGSFIASTADSVVFENGYKFSAQNPTASTPMLTIGVPIGLQFGSSPGSIIGQFTQPDASFSVQSGQTLALAGGDVTLQGSGLSVDNSEESLPALIEANNGQINISSIGGGETVSLNVPNLNRSWDLDFSKVKNYKDLTLSDGLIIFGINTNIVLHGREVRANNEVQLSGPVSPDGQKNVVVSITASDFIELDNTNITPVTNSSVPGGSVNIQAKTLRLVNGSTITTSSSSKDSNPGSAGDISIKAQQVDITNSTISSTGRQASSGGNIFITADQFRLDEGSNLRVSTKGSGNAGTINIFARSVLLDRGSAIGATTQSGQGGSIKLTVQDALVLRNQSNISTSSTSTGNGGNIKILAGVIAAIPSEDSNISTDAVFGNGGKIKITTQGLFGISANTANFSNSSDITARSEFGIDGTIDTSLVSTTPVTNLALLPTALGQKIVKTECFANHKGSNRNSFIYSGRGGLPNTPSEPDQNIAIWQDFRTVSSPINQVNTRQADTPTTTSMPPTSPIIEAQGFSFKPDGSVQLVAAESTNPPPSQACASATPISQPSGSGS